MRYYFFRFLWFMTTICKHNNNNNNNKNNNLIIFKMLQPMKTTWFLQSVLFVLFYGKNWLELISTILMILIQIIFARKINNLIDNSSPELNMLYQIVKKNKKIYFSILERFSSMYFEIFGHHFECYAFWKTFVFTVNHIFFQYILNTLKAQ